MNAPERPAEAERERKPLPIPIKERKECKVAAVRIVQETPHESRRGMPRRLFFLKTFRQINTEF